MKKIICLAIVFTMLLCGCSRWSVEIVDPTKPIENDSELVVSEDETGKTEEKEEPETEEPEEKYEPKSVEKYEAENFFYSDEGYEDMAFFASWLGAKSFEKAEDFVDYGCLRFFAKELFEIVGEDALDEDDSQLSIFESENNPQDTQSDDATDNLTDDTADDTITTTVGDIIEQATAD